MGLVVPGRDAGGLHQRAHRTAVVGAVEQELLQQRRVARHETGTQPGHVGALGQRGEGDQVAEIRAAQARRRFKAAERCLVPEIDLRVALIGRNHKAMAVAQLEQGLPFGQRHHGAARVARRADIHQLGAGPGRHVHLGPIDREIARRVGVGEEDVGAREQRGAFVDLIERIWADDDGRRPGPVDHGLRNREQRFARTIDRQHLAGGVQRQAVAAMNPAGYRLAKRGRAGGGRVAGQPGHRAAQCLFDQRRRGMAGLADAERNRRELGVGRDAGGELPQSLERVGLQPLQQWIHAPSIPDSKPCAGRSTRGAGVQPGLRCSATTLV
mmetsp:Transcript_7493/g.13987  ORF Transcript_7493/g.13987 Transcript_7493/m.13987 type:complete len:326 (+) Transcript_7493:712-1689(+)